MRVAVPVVFAFAIVLGQERRPGLHAQGLPRRGVSLGVEALSMHVTRESGGNAPRSGTLLGGGAGLGLTWGGIEARYLQGAVEDSVGTSQDVAQGELLVRITPMPWLTAKAGPLVRSYVQDAARERWLQWVVRARADIALLDNVATWIEASWGFGGSFSESTRFDNARGGEGGIVVRVSPALAGRLSYRIDRVSLAAGTRHQTVEELSLGLVVGLFGR